MKERKTVPFYETPCSLIGKHHAKSWNVFKAWWVNIIDEFMHIIS